MTACSLCQMEVGAVECRVGEQSFCCPGCRAVYQILASKNGLSDFQTHPIFTQAVKAGLISNPALLDAMRTKEVPSLEAEKFHLEIQEMWCPSCAEIIQLLLLREKGIKGCVVDYSTDLAAIEFYPRYIAKEEILGLIRSFGYQPTPLQEVLGKEVPANLKFRFYVAAFFSLNVMMFAYPIYASYFDGDDGGGGALFAWLSCLASLPVLFYSGWPIFKRCALSLQVGLPGMETLVVLGVSTAFGLSLYELLQGGTHVYFDSMTVIIAFVLLGKMIESKAKFSAKDSLLRLSRALPRKGRKQKKDGLWEFVPIKEIAPGDMVAVYTGEKIVVDGVVVEGGGTCDESLMTGESLPLLKEAGQPVLGGTVLQTGWLIFRVVSSAEESSLQQILNLVEKEIGHKTAYVRAVDPLVRTFVPCVIALAAVTAGLCAWWGIAGGGVRAISILLISCPCAIGIAAPLAEAHLMNGLAKLGALVRNRGALRYLGRETLIAFDKTGTLTEGKLTVLGGLEGVQDASILKKMAALSTHPISRAIYNYLKEGEDSLDHFEEFSGLGLRARSQGITYYLGSGAFLEQNGVQVSLDAPETTSVYFAKGTQLITCITLGDKIRPGAAEALAQLAPTPLILLSGDQPKVVQTVGQACGMTQVVPCCTPLMKRNYVEGWRKEGHIVCMVGEGINDAPSLTAAHVGISMVSATEISIQVSDLLLTTDQLSVLPKIRTLAKKGRKIIHQNIFWAFFYNVLGIGLAITGHLTPLFAAFAMMASSTLVLFNSQRLAKLE